MATAPQQPQKTILAVDDEPVNISLLAGLLGKDYKVRAATSGAKALDLAASSPPDLILLDIKMEGLDGYAVLERLHADPKLRLIPVIMISAIEDIESVIRCIEFGAEDYLPKPFNPTLLRARVKASLEKKDLRDEVERALHALEKELKAARDVQLSMVPDVFRLPTAEQPIEVFAKLEPARDIGGDLYDFFWDEAGRFHFVVADVSGKGAPAALFMARVKTMMRMVATLYRSPQGLADPGYILKHVNDDLSSDNRQDMFVTVFYGLIDAKTGTLSYCNAGHPTAYVIGEKGPVTPVEEARGIPIGIMHDYEYETGTYQMQKGDCIFVYTDGVTEAMDNTSSFFTDEGLQEVLKRLAGQSASAVVNEVIASVDKFANGAQRADDIAVIAIRLVEVA